MSRARSRLRSLRSQSRAIQTIALAHALRVSTRQLGVAVVYHRVEPAATDPATHLVPALAAAVFRRQLALLGAAFELVTASDLHPRVQARRRGERIPLAITFDDDLDCHERVAAPLLARAGATATFFLGGAGPQAYWWDELQRAVDTGAIDRMLASGAIPASVAQAWTGRAESIHAVAGALMALSARERAVAVRHITGAADPARTARRTLRADGARSLAASGFEIGFHTLDHDRLPDLNDDELRSALVSGRGALERAVGKRVVAIAYPHGAADQRVAVAAHAAGYTAGFTTRAAPVSSGQSALLLGRVECSYRSATELALRLLLALRSPGGR